MATKTGAPVAAAPAKAAGDANRERMAGGGRPYSVAIIGRGFTGLAVAIALLRKIRGPLRLCMIDEAGSMGGGLAYGRAGPGHLLNVRAAELSVDPARPNDFADWAAGNDAGGDPGGAPYGHLFLPRRLFQAYVAERFAAMLRSRPDASAQFVEGRARRIHRAGSLYRIRFGWGAGTTADAVVLATGYGVAGSRAFGLDPFAPLPARAARARRAVLIGSGLTMVDALIALRAAGFTGEAVAISRHGRLPGAHLRAPAPPFLWSEPGEDPPTLRQILRRLRSECARAEAQGAPWQSVINGMRLRAQDVWLGLDAADQRRFLRHLRPAWDRARHRMPPDIADWADAELAAGRLILHAGHALECRRKLTGWRVAWRPRGARARGTLAADLAIDCSGHRPDGALAAILRPLLRVGAAAMDAHGLGPRVDRDGAVQRPEGGALPGLFALGPLGYGSLMEICAAPEILRQAEAAATAMRRQLDRPHAPAETADGA